MEAIPNGLVDERFRYFLQQREDGGTSFTDGWEDHKNAADKSYSKYDELTGHLKNVVNSYLSFNNDAQQSKNPTQDLLSTLRRLREDLRSLTENLRDTIEPAVTWSQSEMNHQLALARSGRFGDFDVAELVHAARIVVRSGTRNASAIFEVIKVACAAQYPDGKWPCARPFFWMPSGLAAYPHSAEVAWGLVSITQYCSVSRSG